MDRSIILNDELTFEDAIRALGEGGNGFLAFTNSEKKLLGILTDGDVRRAVLEKKHKLKDIVNFSPDTLNVKCSRQMLVNHLRKIHRRHIPLVNDQGQYCGVFALDDVEFNVQPNKVVIMAGGLGSRLGELTKETPKPMLKVGGKPMLEHLVSMFSEEGFLEFIFCVNYKKDVIKSYFGDGSDFGVSIEYIEEDKKLGTAGALSLFEKTPELPFFVMNADVMTTLNFSQLLKEHIENKNQATLCVREYSYKVPYGVIEHDEAGKVTGLKEKPVKQFSVNAGIYVLDPRLLSYIPNDQFYDMPSLLADALKDGVEVGAYEVDGYWVDIGQPKDFFKANTDFSGYSKGGD